MHIAHVPDDGDKTMGNITGLEPLGGSGERVRRGLTGSGTRATLQNNRK